MISIKKVTERDASVLKYLANRCPPLDKHTPYTYWVVARYNGDVSYILLDDDKPIGFIMSVETPKTILIWQIGVLENFQGKKLSQLLIDAVAKYATEAKKNMEVTISDDNRKSYAAFSGYCSANGLRFERVGVARITDMDDRSFSENETIYLIHVV